MYPCDMVEWLFNSLARLGIVEHHLTRTHIPISIDLPKDGSPTPMFGCANVVA